MNQEPGWLYALQAEGTAYVKVGYSRNLAQRITQLMGECPFPHTGKLFFIATVAIEADLARHETHLHALLAPYRYQGEWYTIDLTAERFQELVTEARALVDAPRPPKRPYGGRPRLETEPLEKLTFMVAPSIRERLEALTAAIQAATPVGNIELSAVCRSALAIGLAQLEDAQRTPAPRTRKGARDAA